MRFIFRICQRFIFRSSLCRFADKFPHMSSTVATRLKLAISRSGKNPRATSIAAGMSQDAVRGILRNPNSSPTIETISKLARALNVSVNWLAFGEGDPSAPSADAPPTGRLVSGYDPDAPDLEGLPPPPDGIRELDVWSGMGGGGYADRDEQDGEWAGNPVKEETWRFPASFVRQELRRAEDRLLVIETRGDSMEPTLHSGDRVIVDTDHTIPSPDGLYALADRFGGMVVKRLHLMRRGDPPAIKVISDNPNHPAEDVFENEIRIVGKVLYGLRKF